MGTENRNDKRPKFRDPNQGSSVTPVILILGLALGIPALLAVCILGVVFGMAFFAAKAGKEFIAEVELEQKRQREMLDKAANNQPKFPPPDPNLPPPPKAPGKNMYDLIALIDPSKDRVHGDRWEVLNKKLHCNDSGLVPRIEIPYIPPAEYDFIVTFSQPGLRNGISLIMPNPKGGSFFWYIGNGNGSGYGFAAKPANFDGQSPGLIQPNTAYTTTVQVRRNSVRGLLDGKELSNVRTDFSDLTSDNWRPIRDTRLLAVACDDPTIFHFVGIVETNGAGKRTR